MNYSAIPANMVNLPNWVARQGKIPYGINGKPAKSNTPSTWSTLQKVKAFLKSAPPAYNGLGFMLERKNNIMCVDVDRCLEDGAPNRTATKVLEKIKTYTEISQSGTGLHLFGFGTMLKSSVKFKSPFDDGTHIEMYAGMDDKNDGGRFIALTSNVYEGRKTLNDIQEGIDWLLSMAPAGKAKAPDKDNHSILPPVAIKENTDDTITVSGVTYTADDIPALIEQCQTGAKQFTWNNLFHKGDLTAYDNDHSRADSALCSILCFWCHGKPALIDKVFRRSALMRYKWDEKRQGAKTYGELTIENALKVWNGRNYTGMSDKPAFPYLTSKGTPLRNHSENFKALIEWLNDVTIRYNQLKHRQEITIEGKCWAVDHGITSLLDYCALYGLSCSVGLVGRWVAKLADDNAYSPVVDYLQDCYTEYKPLSDIYSPVDTLWKTLHLSATAQENETFLADKTGNRRYWVLDLESIDLDTPIDVNLLWGAVMALWKSGKVNYGLTLEEINQLSRINTHYERVTDMEQVLIDSLDWESDIKQWQWVTPTALCTLLEVPSTQARKMGRALTALANNSEYEGIRKKRTNKARVYLLPPVSLSNCDNASDDFDILTDDKEQ